MLGALRDSLARLFGSEAALTSEQARQLEAEVSRVREIKRGSKKGGRDMGAGSDYRGPFSDAYPKCGTCRHFDKTSDSFDASNQCRCTVDGREHWAGDPAKQCPAYDDTRICR